MYKLDNVVEFNVAEGVLVSVLHQSGVSFGYVSKTFLWDKIAFGCQPHLQPASEHPEAFRYYVDDQDRLIIVEETAHA